LPRRVLILDADYADVLLLSVPLGIVAGVYEWNSTLVFALNFLAIVPLATILSFATEGISPKLGETLGGLLNATFRNAVELIMSTKELPLIVIKIKCTSALATLYWRCRNTGRICIT
jgi:Ca2+:H+ antiporter